MSIDTAVNIDYMIPSLRLWLGDIDSTAYRFTDPWLRTALVGSVKALRSWWHDKYLVNDDTYCITRNTDRQYSFEYPEPPIIDHRDEMPIILMASITIKSGSLQNNSWNLGSFRDFEISYNANQIGREQAASLRLDWETLKDYLKPPSHRLATPQKRSIVGFKSNQYEREVTDLG